MDTKSTPSWVHPQKSFLIWINSEHLSRTTDTVSIYFILTRLILKGQKFKINMAFMSKFKDWNTIMRDYYTQTTAYAEVRWRNSVVQDFCSINHCHVFQGLSYKVEDVTWTVFWRFIFQIIVWPLSYLSHITRIVIINRNYMKIIKLKNNLICQLQRGND